VIVDPRFDFFAEIGAFALALLMSIVLVCGLLAAGK
jgi:hypothetical protein